LRWRSLALTGILLSPWFACRLPADSPVGSIPAAGVVAQRVRAVDTQVARIDAWYESTDTADHYRLTRNMPHWQVTGLIVNSNPVRLDAIFSEGDEVREEVYYLADKRLILAVMSQWSDSDLPTKSAQMPLQRKLYFGEDLAIWCDIRGTSTRHGRCSPATPTATGTSTTLPTGVLAERSTVIARFLAGQLGEREAETLLAEFPQAYQADPAS